MKYNSETETLLDFLGAYRRQIIRDGKKYLTVVLDDIFMSINHILNSYDYEGRYASDNGKSYK